MDMRIVYSIQSAILFFIFASPYMYSLTRKVVNLGPYGQVALHGAVYGLVMYALWVVFGK